MKPASLLPFVLLALAFWLLVIRPAQRQRATKAQILSTLGPGSSVVTTSGMRGTVVEVDDDDVLLEIADGVQVHFVKGAIAAVKAEEHEAAPDEHDDQQDSTEHSALTDSSDPSEPTT